MLILILIAAAICAGFFSIAIIAIAEIRFEKWKIKQLKRMKEKEDAES